MTMLLTMILMRYNYIRCSVSFHQFCSSSNFDRALINKTWSMGSSCLGSKKKRWQCWWRWWWWWWWWLCWWWWWWWWWLQTMCLFQFIGSSLPGPWHWGKQVNAKTLPRAFTVGQKPLSGKKSKTIKKSKTSCSWPVQKGWDKSHWKSQRQLKRQRQRQQSVQKHYQEPPRWDKSRWKSQRQLIRQKLCKNITKSLQCGTKAIEKRPKAKTRCLRAGKSKAMQKLGTTTIKPSFFSLQQWSLANISATNARKTSNEKETHLLWNRVVPVQRPFPCSLERWTVSGKEMSLVTAQPTWTFLKLTHRHMITIIFQVHIRGGKIGEAPLHIASRIDEAKGEQCSKWVSVMIFMIGCCWWLF